LNGNKPRLIAGPTLTAGLMLTVSEQSRRKAGNRQGLSDSLPVVASTSAVIVGAKRQPAFCMVPAVPVWIRLSRRQTFGDCDGGKACPHHACPGGHR
jgi:hypothetical protein